MIEDHQERAHKLERIKKRLIEMGLVIDNPAYEKPVQPPINESVSSSPICSIAGCRLKHYKNGFCKKHYKISRSPKVSKDGKNLEV